MKELVAILLLLLLSSFQNPDLQSPAVMPSLEPTTSEPVESKNKLLMRKNLKYGGKNCW